MSGRPKMALGFRELIVGVIVFATISTEVLALERRTANKAGQQPDQWYEKGWKTPASSSKSDTVFIDSERSQRDGHGSGRGAVSDLDDTASGIGPDDEDTPEPGGVEIPEGVDGSGAFDGSRVHGGSGDGEVALPPRPTSRLDVVAPSSTTSSKPPSSTSTSAARLLPVTVATTKPSFMGPVVPRAEDTQQPTSPHHVIETISTTSIRATTSSALYTMRPTTSTEVTPRKRPITVMTTVKTTTRESHKVSPKLPPMLDDTNKTTPQNFWMRPGVLAGLIGGAVAGLLTAILLVMFVVYRMRKKDEGSYALDEPKSPPAYTYAYQKAPTREFYA